MPQRVNAGEGQTIAQYGHDQGPNECSPDAPASAEQTRPPDHNCRNAVEIGTLQRVRVSVGDAAQREPRADPVEEGREGIDGKQSVLDGDADEPGRRTVVADCVNVSTPGGLREQVPHQGVQSEHDHHPVGDSGAANNPAVPCPAEQFVSHGEGPTLRKQARSSGDDPKQTECDDKRGQRQPAHERPGNKTNARAQQDCE